MKSFAILPLLVFSSLLSAIPLPTHERFVLEGGGNSAKALNLISNWGGGEKAKILIVTWASDEPAYTFDHLFTSFAAYPHLVIQESIRYEQLLGKDPNEGEMLSQLDAYNVIFFSGGFQDRVMKVIAAFPKIASKLNERALAGAIVSGTSAGTAIMSKTMLDGELLHPEIYWTATGLGVLPETIIVDQHFNTRPFRQERLEVALKKDPKAMWGVGIDEGGAVSFVDTRMEVLEGDVHIFHKAKTLETRELHPGESMEFAPAPAPTLDKKHI